MRDTRFLPNYTNSRALLIGINDYVNARPLSYAVSDAKGVRDVLVDELGFPPENTVLLLDGQATRDGIRHAFHELAADSMDSDERIILFFAGHGHTQPGNRGQIGYLVPCDGDLHDLSTLIRWDDLTRDADLVHAKHMLFIMDACYGGLALTRNPAQGSARFLSDMMLRYSRQVLAAGKADEVVADSGGPLPDHSVFTGHLIEGLGGRANTEDGILTANGLMSYVYRRVANDRNSHQTPHYGNLDGDGDMILSAPQMALQQGSSEYLDTLLVVRAGDVEWPEGTSTQKIAKVKSLLAADSAAIELYDVVANEVRRFLSLTSEDHFGMGQQFSNEELLWRIAMYEDAVRDLALVTACIAYWGKPTHKAILQKAVSRATAPVESQASLRALTSLHWYPLVIDLYTSGIAAIEGRRFDSLATILGAPVDHPNHGRGQNTFLESVAYAILEMARGNVFQRIPGNGQSLTAMSDHLFKVLQPQLGDLLFVGQGKGYKRVFDEFEITFALVTADLYQQREGEVWAPIGCFGLREQGGHPELARVVDEARDEGENWGPLAHGFFGGSAQRFSEVADLFLQWVRELNWRRM